MDFTIPEQIRDLVATVRRFVDEEVLPVERLVLENRFGAAGPEIARLRETVRGMGLLAPHMPREWGGGGLSLRDFAPLGEALGRSVIGHYVFNAQAPDAGNMELLLHHGSAGAEGALAPPARPGGDPELLRHDRARVPRLEPRPAGHHRPAGGRRDYVIDGHKWFTSAADGAAFCIVMAVTNPDHPKPHARASQILVPTDTPGFEIVQNLSVMGERGEGWMSHAEVRLDRRAGAGRQPHRRRGGGVPARPGAAGAGPHPPLRALAGHLRAGVRPDVRAGRDPRAVAPAGRSGSRQIVQEWIAESRAEIDAARLLVLRTAWRIDHEGAAAARDDISLIKFHTAAVLQRVLDRAIQTHGALGLTEATPLAFWWRHERGARIYDGADEVHKTAVARRILTGYGMKRGDE